ncbi:MAG: Mur ligase family protein [Candidatus Paceibacterota bacterium]
MTSHKGHFKDKKITVHGLGLLGRGIGDVIFLAKEGADLLVTDLKTKEQLEASLEKIKKEVGPDLYKKIKFVLGEHRLEDFKNKDFILKSADIPLNSIYIAEARKNNIPIKMDASWLAELAPEGVTIIGVTGTRGKSTTTHLIHDILTLNKNPRRVLGKNKVCCNDVYLGGNVRGLATLPLLKKVKAGDIVVMELDSWQLQGFGDSKISPNISVFTNLMVDHQNYYHNDMNLYFADKANIFLNQKEGDSLICGKEVLGLIRKKFKKFAGQAIVPDAGVVPKSWKVKLLGEHNRLNIAHAITVARILDIPEKIIKTAVENYVGVPGRLEFVREVKGVKYYNDTTATTPDGVMAALKALGGFPEGNPLKASPAFAKASSGRQGLPSKKPRIILLGGGRDKELDYKKYAPVVKKSVKSLALFAGTGSDKIIKALGRTKLPVKVFDNMPEAFAWSNAETKKGDIVLLSPGAASFGVFKNEFDRGDQFVAQIKKLK